MKRFFVLALLAIAFSARADHAPTELPLSEVSKARLVGILGEALHNSDINQQQYERAVSWVHATPCNGVDRRLGIHRRAQLEAVIAKQQKRETVRVFNAFRYGGWFIVYTDASDGDEPYLFYRQDPTVGNRPLAAWSGAANIFETSDIAHWVRRNASGIPTRLADCFAWHVTLNRE